MVRPAIALILLLAATLAGILAPPAASAGTYRWVDKDGVVHYSDRPIEGAQKVPMPQAQTYEAPRAPAAPAANPKLTAPAPAASTGESPCAIVSPMAEQALINVPSVTVSLRGPPGTTPQVFFDGALVKDASGAPSLTITPIARGEHSVSAAFFTPAGQELCRAAAVKFYVRQPSVFAPLRKPKPPPR
jgi:hypothetical protein